MYRQSNTKRTLLLVVFCLLIFLLLLNLPFVRDLPVVSPVRGVFLSAFSFILSGGEGASSWGQQFFALRELQQEYQTLRQGYGEVQAKNQFNDELLRENDRLRRLVGFRGANYRIRMLAAEVIGKSPSQWFEVITINRGSNDGVRSDMVVISPEGLVGRTFDVTAGSSKVLLLTDPNSAVSGNDQTSRDIGVVVGRKSDPLFMKYVSSSASINKGESIVTSGVSDRFPKGIKIGVVAEVKKRDYDLFQQVEVTPAVDFSKLEEVFVLY